MRSEGFFFRGRGHYTIFLYSRPERAKIRLAPWPENWHLLAVVQKNTVMKRDLIHYCRGVHFWTLNSLESYTCEKRLQRSKFIVFFPALSITNASFIRQPFWRGWNRFKGVVFNLQSYQALAYKLFFCRHYIFNF